MKSGFVMLAGRSNVGKSTLLNELIGTKVAIVTPKPQTTRRPIRGILHEQRGQIVFVDTPGVFLGKKDIVSNKLNDFVKETLEGVDAIVYVVDPTREAGAEEEVIRKMLRAVTIPVILAINKMDLARPGQTASANIIDVGQVTTLEVSALKRKNLNALVDAIFSILKDDVPYYPEHQLTDIEHSQWIAELIREKLFLNLEQELPYSIHVTIESIEPRPDGSRYIEATVWTTEERYKGIVIGKKAEMLKRVGSAAREELEAAMNSKVFLKLEVKVDPKWPQRFAS
ncbi:GTPase Era [Patescibacteria group bacterium]|nr:GTPase Era [Patescibacteria group bacterium]